MELFARKKLNKKGQMVKAFTTGAIALIILAIVLSLGGQIGDTLKNQNQKFTGTTQTVTATGDTQLSHSDIREVSVVNATGGETVDPGNYTVAQPEGRLLMTGVYTDESVNVTYKYHAFSGSYNATTASTEAGSTLIEFGPTLAIVLVAAGLIGLLLRFR